jgi:hypothetical protein
VKARGWIEPSAWSMTRLKSICIEPDPQPADARWLMICVELGSSGAAEMSW